MSMNPEFCDEQFSCQSVLSHHAYKQMPHKPFKCDLCQREFVLRRYFEKHLQTHEKPIVCEVCQKTFIHQSKMIEHFRLHTLEKPYQCEVCKKRFPYSQSLKSHQRMHKKHPPCGVCAKKHPPSGQKQAFCQHMKKETFTCQFCQKVFAYKGYLASHISDNHSTRESLVCIVCQEEFSGECNNNAVSIKTEISEEDCRISELVEQISADTLCEICQIGFSCKARMKEHLKLCHRGAKPYECKVCQKKFALRSMLVQHLYMHNCEKHFVCETCQTCLSKNDFINV